MLSVAALTVTLAILITFVVQRIRRGPGPMERSLWHRMEEWRAFREVLNAARRDHAARFLEALYAWLVIRSRASLDRTLRVFRAASPAAQNLTVAVEAALFRDEQSRVDMRSARAICHHARGWLKRPLGRRGRSRLNTDRGETP